MTYRDTIPTVSEWADLAITKRDEGGSSLPLIEFVELSAPRNYEFWWAMAAELHRRNLALEATDFWWRAVAEVPPANRVGVLEDMACTLWSASDCGRDDYLADLSLQALRRAERWEVLAHRIAALARDEKELIEAIRCALVASERLEEAVVVGEHEINDWQSLGHFFAKRGDFAKAFDSYGRAFEASGDKKNLLQCVLRDITACAKTSRLA